MSLLSEESSSSNLDSITRSIVEVMKDETRSLTLCREILRAWSKESKVRYVPPVFRGSLKYKRFKVNYSGLYFYEGPRIFLNRESWKLNATDAWWKANILTLAHEFVHHLQYMRSGKDPYAAFPMWELDKVHCMRTHEGEAKSISKEMTDQIFDRISKGEISLLPRDGLFTELERWFARDITGVERTGAQGNPGNPDLMHAPSFAIPPTYRTPKQQFEFLAIDNILKAVTSSRQAIARLEILRERAEGAEVEKINNIISNINEIDEELIEMKSSMERRGEQPTMEPIGFMDTSDLDRRTRTERLILRIWLSLKSSWGFLERSQGSLRNLRARLLEMGQTEEAENIEREIKKLTEFGKELYEKQMQIQELKVGESGVHAIGECPLCWVEAHTGKG